MKRFATTLILCALCCSLGCVPESNDADQVQAQATKKALSEANRQVGMPDITKFTERKLARDILELRDKALPTYAYIVNMHGDLIYLGEAIGYGLPYSVQFTNPEKIVEKSAHYGYVTLPQADPNGLFMPDGLSATWLLLKGPNGEVKPVYVEPEIVVSPFKLHVEKIVARAK